MLRSDIQVSYNLLIDPENGGEMARRCDRHRLVTEFLGGHLFPQDVDASRIERALDLSCGPGNWVQDAAFWHQRMEVIGVDVSRAMVEYARAMSRVQMLENSSYQVMDIRRPPLKFDDASFDYIQGLWLAQEIEAGQWPGLLAECQRLLRPGGVIRLLETEWPETNCPAVQHLGRIVVRARQLTGRGYDPEGQCLGAVAPLAPMLCEAGFAQVRSRRVEVPFSTSPIGLHPIMELLRKALYLMEPALLCWDVTTHEQFEDLLRQMELEGICDEFRGTLCIGEAWAQRGLGCPQEGGR